MNEILKEVYFMSKKTDDRLTQFKLYSPLKVIVDIIESIMKKRGE